MSDALYVPDFKNNLLSVANICDKGYTVIFNKDGCKIVRKNGEKNLGHPRVNKMKRMFPNYSINICETCQVAKGI